MNRKLHWFAALVALSTGAQAAVSADEAKTLGTTLTAVGAEKAGNAAGTIPAYTGGLTTAPAGFKPGDGIRPDPFASEKPRLQIDAKNMATYAPQLTEGTKALMQKYPTFRIDVYPTHRTVAFPKFVIDNTAKAALSAKTLNDGRSIEGAHAGFPFPIPKTGYEAMWNHLLTYRGLGFSAKYDSWNVDSAGTPILATTGDIVYAWPNNDPKKTGVMKETEPFWYIKLFYLAPARRNGEALMLWDSLNPLKQGRRAWQYLPGQRRVKLAPDIAYDTPNPGSAGASTYDDATVFNGAMDRFDFKIIGKKEMYVPYSNYRLSNEAKVAEITKPGHINPDLVRWELHRVWVIEATLKEGKRHIYSKRVFYLDEDSWQALASDEYDGRGQIYRSAFSHLSFSYDVQAPLVDTQSFNDFSSGAYNITGLFGPYAGVKYLTEMPAESFWSPDALAGAGVR
jgi:hypothetical protein